jgi:hypothetical protein
VILSNCYIEEGFRNGNVLGPFFLSPRSFRWFIKCLPATYATD